MSGRPVWLASMARRAANGLIIPALKWSPGQRRKAMARLRGELAGVGNPSMERCFIMCITMCMHRALSDDEVAALPAEWKRAPALDVAGGPIKILYAKGCTDVPSMLPCEHYLKREIDGTDFEGDPLWIPEECGKCGPCLARDAAHEQACQT